VIGGLAAMRVPQLAMGDRARSVGSTLADGVRYAWNTGPIRNLLVLLAVCAGLGFQFAVLLPVYTRDVLHAGPRVYGALLAAFGAGSLVAAVRMTMTHNRWALRRHLLIGLALGGAGMAGFAWIHWLPGMMTMAAIAGFGLILYVSSTNTLIQMTTEDRYRGRVMSLYTLMFVGTAPFGALMAGAVAQRFGAPASTSVCAVILLGGALWISRRLREIAARESAARAEQEAEPTV
jgi:predicted MFS family arabinose efflux permease